MIRTTSPPQGASLTAPGSKRRDRARAPTGPRARRLVDERRAGFREGRESQPRARRCAGRVVEPRHPHVESVEVAGPGFELPPPRHVAARVLREVVESGVDGYASRHRARRASDDRVSSRRTRLGLARRQRLVRFYGDALAALSARSRGHPRVLRERHRRPGPALRCEHPGSQARPARSRGRLSRSVRRDLGEQYDGPDDVAEAGRWGGERVEDIRTTLESINIHYDEWYSQASIEEGRGRETIEVLRARG